MEQHVLRGGRSHLCLRNGSCLAHGGRLNIELRFNNNSEIFIRYNFLATVCGCDFWPLEVLFKAIQHLFQTIM